MLKHRIGGDYKPHPEGEFPMALEVWREVPAYEGEDSKYESKPTVMFRFVSEEKMDDGRPWTSNVYYNYTLDRRANLTVLFKLAEGRVPKSGDHDQLYEKGFDGWLGTQIRAVIEDIGEGKNRIVTMLKPFPNQNVPWDREAQAREQERADASTAFQAPTQPQEPVTQLKGRPEKDQLADLSPKQVLKLLWDKHELPKVEREKWATEFATRIKLSFAELSESADSVWQRLLELERERLEGGETDSPYPSDPFEED